MTKTAKKQLKKNNTKKMKGGQGGVLGFFNKMLGRNVEEEEDERPVSQTVSSGVSVAPPQEPETPILNGGRRRKTKKATRKAKKGGRTAKKGSRKANKSRRTRK